MNNFIFVLCSYYTIKKTRMLNAIRVYQLLIRVYPRAMIPAGNNRYSRH